MRVLFPVWFEFNLTWAVPLARQDGLGPVGKVKLKEFGIPKVKTAGMMPGIMTSLQSVSAKKEDVEE